MDDYSYLVRLHAHLKLDENGQINLDNLENPKLLPPKNLRRVDPRVCATCKHLIVTDGFAICSRPNGFSGDAGDMEHWLNTCDRWAGR